MNKKRIYHIVEWVIALAACGFLVWKLVTYDDYATLWATLRAMGPMQWGALALCVALMPVNMAIEAWKWRTLIIHNSQFTIHNSQFTILSPKGHDYLTESNLHNAQFTPDRFSFAEAQRQVYYSKLAGLITPWRLGEYPARAVLMARASIHNSQFTIHNSQLRIKNAQATSSEREIWARVLSMGAVGSATMTAAIVIAGLLGLGVLGITGDAGVLNGVENGYWWLVGGVLLGTVILAVAGWLVSIRTCRLTVGSPSVDRRDIMLILLKSLGQSMVRLLCWCVQLILVLYALGAISPQYSAISLQPSVFSLSFIYYLLVTVTPNVPVAEVGVRGAWAIVLFGTPAAALAGVLLWAINTLLPCLVWPFMRKKT